MVMVDNEPSATGNISNHKADDKYTNIADN